MALRRPRDRAAQPGLAREVDAQTLQVAEAASVREEPYGKDEDVVAPARRDARGARAAAVPTARFFVGASDGVDAAVTTLYSDGAPRRSRTSRRCGDFRRRGLARATVSAAIDAARRRWATRSIFIVADDDDWPKDLYARLGFDPVGRAWAFTRPGPEHPAHVATP